MTTTIITLTYTSSSRWRRWGGYCSMCYCYCCYWWWCWWGWLSCCCCWWWGDDDNEDGDDDDVDGDSYDDYGDDDGDGDDGDDGDGGADGDDEVMMMMMVMMMATIVSVMFAQMPFKFIDHLCSEDSLASGSRTQKYQASWYKQIRPCMETANRVLHCLQDKKHIFIRITLNSKKLNRARHCGQH